MITLRSGNHMIKLAMSHAIAQSVKMSVFEQQMDATMESSRWLPADLALTGELGMTRAQVVKMSGRLFRIRVDVNLSSNVLDTPNIFWDSEPQLHDLYSAVREYLEIGSRVAVLNDRVRVLFDLLDILSDSIADSNMARITWTIIILIMISALVTGTEVIFRFLLLSKHS
jgi:uncharacterized Rmd1/YagE family protein